MDEDVFTAEDRAAFILLGVACFVLCILAVVYAYFDTKRRRRKEEEETAQRLAESMGHAATGAGAPSQSQSSSTEEYDRAAASAVAISLLDYMSFQREKGLGRSSSSSEKKKKECVVCLAAVKDDEVYCLLPMCHHEFHPGCVEKWLRTSKSGKDALEPTSQGASAEPISRLGASRNTRLEPSGAF